MIDKFGTNPLSVYYIVTAVGVYAALGIACVMSPAPDDLPLVAIAAVMIAAAFVAVRNLSIGVIAAATPLAHHLALASEARRKARGIAPPIELQRSSPANRMVVSAIAVALAFETGLFSTRMITGDLYPVGAVRFMQEHDLSGNILNDFGWGEYLIWHMAPQSKVFIDGRYDTVFPRQVIDDFLRFNYAQHGGNEILNRYHHDFILMKPNAPARELMKSAPGWTLIYDDATALLYAPAGSAAAKIPLLRGRAPQCYFP